MNKYMYLYGLTVIVNVAFVYLGIVKLCEAYNAYLGQNMTAHNFEMRNVYILRMFTYKTRFDQFWHNYNVN